MQKGHKQGLEPRTIFLQSNSAVGAARKETSQSDTFYVLGPSFLKNLYFCGIFNLILAHMAKGLETTDVKHSLVALACWKGNLWLDLESFAAF